MARTYLFKFDNGLTVGGRGNFTAPSTFSIGMEDIDLESKRSMSGYLNRNRVRGGSKAPYTMEVSWDKLSESDLNRLILAADNPSVNVQLVDPRVPGGYSTKKMYRQASMKYELSYIDSDGVYWWKVPTMQYIGY